MGIIYILKITVKNPSKTKTRGLMTEIDEDHRLPVVWNYLDPTEDVNKNHTRNTQWKESGSNAVWRRRIVVVKREVRHDRVWWRRRLLIPTTTITMPIIRWRVIINPTATSIRWRWRGKVRRIWRRRWRRANGIKWWRRRRRRQRWGRWRRRWVRNWLAWVVTRRTHCARNCRLRLRTYLVSAAYEEE